MDEIEQWKFEVRQAMLDCASAEKRGDSAAIDATSTRACELVDELAAKISAERERCAALLDAAHEQRRHIDNYAAFYARMIREARLIEWPNADLSGRTRSA